MIATPATHGRVSDSSRTETDCLPVGMLVSTVIRTMRSMVLFAVIVLERERRSCAEGGQSALASAR